jgi:hypothetical protein
MKFMAFFMLLKKIVQGKENMSPQNTAMEEICRGCNSVADVVRKKSEFELNLKTKGITVAEEIDHLEETKYNVVDEKLLKKYTQEFDFDEEDVLNALRFFSKINFMRKGKNRVRFEKCGHIILTGKFLTRKLSGDLEVKDQKRDIPFATDIYFVTNRLWYTLNKGFSKSGSIPATLDVVSKAQLALASLRNRSLEKKYSSLKKELKSGTINIEKAQEFYFGLREKAKRPEDLTSEQVDESLDIIFDNDFEKHLREKSSLEDELKEKKESINKLRIYKFQEERRKRKPIKKITNIFYFFCWSVISIIYLVIVTGLGYIIFITRGSPDSINNFVDTVL